MYANLILLREPLNEGGELPTATPLSTGVIEVPHFPCWHELGVVAELNVEPHDLGEFALEVRLTELTTDEEHILLRGQIVGNNSPTENLVPRVEAYSVNARLGIFFPIQAEFSAWVNGVRVGRRSLAVLNEGSKF